MEYENFMYAMYKTKLQVFPGLCHFEFFGLCPRFLTNKKSKSIRKNKLYIWHHKFETLLRSSQPPHHYYHCHHHHYLTNLVIITTFIIIVIEHLHCLHHHHHHNHPNCHFRPRHLCYDSHPTPITGIYCLFHSHNIFHDFLFQCIILSVNYQT